MAAATAGTGPGELRWQRAIARGWLVLAALAGAAEASSPADAPSEQATTSSAQTAAVSRAPGRGVSRSRAAPAR